MTEPMWQPLPHLDTAQLDQKYAANKKTVEGLIVKAAAAMVDTGPENTALLTTTGLLNSGARPEMLASALATAVVELVLHRYPGIAPSTGTNLNELLDEPVDPPAPALNTTHTPAEVHARVEAFTDALSRLTAEHGIAIAHVDGYYGEGHDVCLHDVTSDEALTAWWHYDRDFHIGANFRWDTFAARYRCNDATGYPESWAI